MNFQFKSKSILYLEIYEHYKKYIEAGVIPCDERLPAVRTLAYELGINPNTVQRAYTELEKDGYIKTLPKKGVYVIYKSTPTPQRVRFIQELTTWKAQGLTKEEALDACSKVYKGGTHD
ncbi:MAG: GntR family transcriptional regulator [Bacilli bacterium]|nr:GntR family transcriptional regulator [Bacilli bacterium]